MATPFPRGFPARPFEAVPLAVMLLAALAAGCASTGSGAGASAPPVPVAKPAVGFTPDLDQQSAVEALPALAQKLLSALPQDTTPWQQYLADDALYVTEGGEIMAKGELLQGFRTFPTGITGSIQVENPRVIDRGDTALLVFDALERQSIFSQAIEVRYYGTQTWRRDAGRWRLVLTQAAVRAVDPKPMPVAAARLKDYVGTYDVDGHWPVQVALVKGQLLSGPPGGEQRPLIPVGDNVFAETGNPLGVIRIFLRGKSGKVDRFVQRRKFADLVWKKAK